MPLFMDFHKIPNISLDDVVNAHMADVAIQEQYGVKYLQFWVNQRDGAVFCLTEGPDAKTCEMVHQMAHGNLACAITEVDPGTYKVFMGENHKLELGLVKNGDDSLDMGYRSILSTTIRSLAGSAHSSDLQSLEIPPGAKQRVLDSVRKHNGREVKWPADDSIIAVFHDATDAVKCGHQIQSMLLPDPLHPKLVFKIGISCDQPVTEDGEFFTRAIKLARRLIQTAQDNQILISSLVKELCHEGLDSSFPIKTLNSADELFVSELLDYAEQNLSNNNYNIESLCKDIGISRPQLYRKVTSLTGRAPNDFLRDIRMEKAVTLLKRRVGNISEVALEVGYNNPSYFSKCFADKFGCMPSEVAARQYV
ncbi:MAG TPA: nickel-binding protein [Chryseolinea sp.]|nr:nickel-binding protein [Chryseolinea sp.]